MMYKPQVDRLVRSYENTVAWGNGDHEEALHEAIKTAFPGLNEEGQAELYTRIEEAWEEYRTKLAPRRLWIGSIVNKFMSGRVSDAVRGLKIKTNVPERITEVGLPLNNGEDKDE